MSNIRSAEPNPRDLRTRPPLSVVHLASEVAPFSKTGGLADVAAALPQALAEAGLDSVVISPLYPSVAKAGLPLTPAGALRVTVAGAANDVRLAQLNHRGVNYIFIDEPCAFARDSIYGDAKGDYPDNAERFVLFCRAALDAVRVLRLAPDVVHCHDWQTGPVPLFLKHTGMDYRRIPTVFTVHNLGYQGNFPREKFDLLEAPARLLSAEGVEFHGSVGFLKTGLVFADRLTTVSPTYADEIRTPELGFGLDGVLRGRGSDLSGILNGIDTEVWNPRTDALLFRAFDEKSLDGKAANRNELARSLGLREDNSPLFSAVTRLASQKGIDKIIERIPALVSAGARIAILGTGAPEYETALETLENRNAGAVSVTLGFSEELAHRIYASSDYFLMPSEYEPCGLGQMISLRYATLPVAARTGGLSDSIIDLDENPDNGTGFLFQRGSGEDFSRKLDRALELHRDAGRFRRARLRAMAADFSWNAQARKYVELYRELTRRG